MTMSLPRAVECPVYHERQVKQLCALHALNNLLQDQAAFSQADLDNICNKLSPDTFINPHKSMLGRGNYDVNVLITALQQKGLETVWFDKRKDVEVLRLDNIMGFILNIPTDYKLGFLKLKNFVNFKHWVAIRWLKSQGQYMNLDSKLDKPEAIGDDDSLLQFLHSELSEGDKELFLVLNPDVYRDSTWKVDNSSLLGGEQTDQQKCSGLSNGSEITNDSPSEDIGSVSESDLVERTSSDCGFQEQETNTNET